MMRNQKNGERDFVERSKINTMIGFFRAGNVYVVDRDLSPQYIEIGEIPKFIKLFKDIYPGYDFRLPNIHELKYMYLINEIGLGRFKKSHYLATSHVKNSDLYYSLGFDSGFPVLLGAEDMDDSFKVRLVVDIKE